jgi:hypothetical protein
MITPLKTTVRPSSDYGLWVGFNDLNPFQPDSNILLCTGSVNWDKPPRLGELADVVAFDSKNQEGIVIGHTMAVNYPIGARPQSVIANGLPNYLINNIVDNIPCLDIYDHQFNHIKSINGFHHWCTKKDGSHSFCLDFEVTHRLGGYGYIFGNHKLGLSGYKYPNSISLYSHQDDNFSQLLSIDDAAKLVAERLGLNQGSIRENAYISHLLLSPSENRLAFLFRSWLRDGGILTVLMSLDLEKGISFKFLNIELVGQLSHFSWSNENEIIIYCYQVLSKQSLRLKLHTVSQLLPISKLSKAAVNVLRSVVTRKHKKSLGWDEANAFPFVKSQQLPCFMMVKDSQAKPVSFGLPNVDGHPSVIRSSSGPILVSDTYPNKYNNRCLFTIDLSSENVIIKELHSEYHPALIPTYSWVTRHIRLPSHAVFPVADQSFTRSGLHCDLHPFVNAEGNMLGYHVSEDGYRTVKVVKI